MKENRSFRKISKRLTNEFLIDVKNKFKIKKFETILLILRSKYSPNKYSNCDLKAKNTEINFVENIINEGDFLQLRNYSLKFNLYTQLFEYIIETINNNLIDEFKIADIKTIIDEQMVVLYKISKEIRYSIKEINNEFVFQTEKKPFFTNINILRVLNDWIDECAFIFDKIQQNKEKTVNSYWNKKNIEQFRSILKDMPTSLSQINPKPEFPDLFFDQDYKNILVKNKKGHKLDYESIYSPFQINTKEDSHYSKFDFNISKRELMLLVVLLYEFDILRPLNTDSSQKDFLSKDLIYTKTSKNIDVNTDREIVFFIENFCSINKKKIINVKTELNNMRENSYIYFKSFESLIVKLNSFNGFKKDKNILPFLINIRTNEIFDLQNDLPKEPKELSINNILI